MSMTKQESNKKYYEQNKEKIRKNRRNKYKENITKERTGALKRYYKTRKLKNIRLKLLKELTKHEKFVLNDKII